MNSLIITGIVCVSLIILGLFYEIIKDIVKYKIIRWKMKKTGVFYKFTDENGVVSENWIANSILEEQKGIARALKLKKLLNKNKSIWKGTA